MVSYCVEWMSASLSWATHRAGGGPQCKKAEPFKWESHFELEIGQNSITMCTKVGDFPPLTPSNPLLARSIQCGGGEEEAFSGTGSRYYCCTHLFIARRQSVAYVSGQRASEGWVAKFIIAIFAVVGRNCTAWGNKDYTTHIGTPT